MKNKIGPLATVSVLFFVMVMGACGSGQKGFGVDGKNSGFNDIFEKEEIDCYNEKCESDKQYCLRSIMEISLDWYKTAECMPRPKSCNDCQCAEKDARKIFDGAKNCRGEVQCTHENSKIVVTCIVPPNS